MKTESISSFWRTNQEIREKDENYITDLVDSSYKRKVCDCLNF